MATTKKNKYTDIDLSVYDNGYQMSDTVKGAYDKASAAENAYADFINKGFTYGKQADYDSVWDQINNREKFSFDLNGDALYQQYKDKYIQQGKMAMQDTMGQAAAMTGGYGNSYAATAGNQAYQASLQNLNDIVPQLYQMAYDRYNQEGQDLYNKYSMLSADRNTEYGMWGDKANLLLTDRGYYTDRADTEYSKDYGTWSDNRTYDTTQYWNETDYGYGVERDKVADEQWRKNFEYEQERDAIEDAQWEKNFKEGQQTTAYNKALALAQSGVYPSRDLLDEAGMTQEEATALVEAYKNKQSSSPGGSPGDTPGDTTPQPYTKEYYADWDAGDWEGYFAKIRQSEGTAAADKELTKFTSNGLIPKNMVTYAAIGVRGGLKGH